jgi:hypothetical protein
MKKMNPSLFHQKVITEAFKTCDEEKFQDLQLALLEVWIIYVKF